MNYPTMYSCADQTNTNTKIENELQNEGPVPVDDQIIFISKQEYDDVKNRIEKLQIAKDYNQTIIDQLIRKMQQLQHIYLSSRPINAYKANTNDSEGDIAINS
eukprot:146316_1